MKINKYLKIQYFSFECRCLLREAGVGVGCVDCTLFQFALFICRFGLYFFFSFIPKGSWGTGGENGDAGIAPNGGGGGPPIPGGGGGGGGPPPGGGGGGGGGGGPPPGGGGGGGGGGTPPPPGRGGGGGGMPPPGGGGGGGGGGTPPPMTAFSLLLTSDILCVKEKIIISVNISEQQPVFFTNPLPQIYKRIIPKIILINIIIFTILIP